MILYVIMYTRLQMEMTNTELESCNCPRVKDVLKNSINDFHKDMNELEDILLEVIKNASA